jgi:hypothetical protein
MMFFSFVFILIKWKGKNTNIFVDFHVRSTQNVAFVSRRKSFFSFDESKFSSGHALFKWKQAEKLLDKNLYSIVSRLRVLNGLAFEEFVGEC